MSKIFSNKHIRREILSAKKMIATDYQIKICDTGWHYSEALIHGIVCE
jgi:hypothetical protein